MGLVLEWVSYNPVGEQIGRGDDISPDVTVGIRCRSRRVMATDAVLRAYISTLSTSPGGPQDFIAAADVAPDGPGVSVDEPDVRIEVSGAVG